MRSNNGNGYIVQLSANDLWPFSKPRLRIQLKLDWRFYFVQFAYVLRASDERTEPEDKSKDVVSKRAYVSYYVAYLNYLYMSCFVVL